MTATNRIDQYLKYLITTGGSDLHMPAGSRPLIRLHGELVRLKGDPLDPKDTLAMAMEMLTHRQKEILKEKKDVDYSYDIENVGRFRANAYLQRKGLDMVFRAIPAKIPTIGELGFPASVERFANERQGIILVTGPGGCGKSTTQAAIINHINTTREEHIITVEDPIEFIHQDRKCLVNQREAGINTKSFAVALRASLRQDPDVILVGEMRDLETISMAITAAETGHLVIGTLHTISAGQSVDRIIDVFPGEQRSQIRTMVSESLVGVVSQQLVKSADGRSRVAAAEILVCTPSVRNLVREAKTFRLLSAMQTGREQGMQLMDESLANLCKEGKITYETGLERAENKEDYEHMAK